jgi:hypothetical protein
MKDELNILLILVVLNLCVTMFLIARSFSVTIKKGSFPFGAENSWRMAVLDCIHSRLRSVWNTAGRQANRFQDAGVDLFCALADLGNLQTDAEKESIIFCFVVSNATKLSECQHQIKNTSKNAKPNDTTSNLCNNGLHDFHLHFHAWDCNFHCWMVCRPWTR